MFSVRALAVGSAERIGAAYEAAMTCESTNGFIVGAAGRGSEALTTASAEDDGKVTGRVCEASRWAVAFACERMRPGSLVAGKASSIRATFIAAPSAGRARLGNRFDADDR